MPCHMSRVWQGFQNFSSHTHGNISVMRAESPAPSRPLLGMFRKRHAGCSSGFSVVDMQMQKPSQRSWWPGSRSHHNSSAAAHKIIQSYYHHTINGHLIAVSTRRSSSNNSCNAVSSRATLISVQSAQFEALSIRKMAEPIQLRQKLLVPTSFGRQPAKRDRFAGFVAEANSAGPADLGGVAGAAGLMEPICPSIPKHPDPALTNEDFMPTMPEKRNFSLLDMTSLWVGLVVGIPSYYLAGSLVEMGMSWWQGIGTVFLGNVLVYFPLVLTGHAGTKYGIPFPVLARASFGVKGANIPTLLRALVGCGWFGIETWIGGQAIFHLVNVWMGGKLNASVIPWIGTTIPELSCFLLFWLLQVGIIINGIESIRELERYSAPILTVLSAALLIWVYVKAGGFGRMLSAPSQFGPNGPKAGQFWKVFFPALTANVGFWATLSLNIPDFTRYAKSQADQMLGQAGIPIFMAAFAFVGLAVTSSTEILFGKVISNPVEVVVKIGGFLPIFLSLIGVILATLTTNIAANVVAPANALVNVNPSMFSFRKGGLLTAALGVLFQPWRLLQSTHGFINTWLIGYSALLGPLGGIILADYYLLRHRHLDIDSLYSSSKEGPYWFFGGINFSAIFALVSGVLPCMPGFLHVAGLLKNVPNGFLVLYDNAWFAGFGIAGLVYLILSISQKWLLIWQKRFQARGLDQNWRHG
ncbi:hypothetical protein O6H91_04G020200 [Diphasiastrum complanatum]|nr:hypothetical protein O6H91_04G020200 [Diphasiastrum complanatum]